MCVCVRVYACACAHVCVCVCVETEEIDFTFAVMTFVLFNGAVSRSVYMAWNDRMVRKYRILNKAEGSVPGLM